MSSQKSVKLQNEDTFVFIDVSKKQDFIYKNNKIKENMFNSVLINLVTEEIKDKDQLIKKEDESNKKIFTQLNDYIKNNKSAKCIYSGGGNSIIKFDSKDSAINFIETYSGQILKEHPSLELYMSYVNVDEYRRSPKDPNSEKLDESVEIHKKLIQKCDELKDRRKSQMKRWSYGIEKINEIGKPKEIFLDKIESQKEFKDDNENINSDQEYKFAKSFFETKFKNKIRNALSNSQKSIENFDKKIEITYELEEYKKLSEKKNADTDKKISENTEIKNYMGVIAIDGNKMGELVAALGKNYGPSESISYFEKLGKFSEEIDELYSLAIGNALNTICERYSIADDVKLFITPIVFAGDDITLITESNYSIELASEIIKEIHKLSKLVEENTTEKSNYPIIHELMGLVEKNKTKYDQIDSKKLEMTGLERFENLTAAAGVAIVKPGYPFFEAIKIAEDRQKKAKESMHKITSKNSSDSQIRELDKNIYEYQSMIDWEVVKGSNKEEINYEKYSKEGNLKKVYHIKPLWIKYNLAKDKENKNNKFYDIENNIFCYDGFIELVETMKEVTGAFENIKKSIYKGSKQYELAFDLFKNQNLDKIDEKILKLLELKELNSNIVVEYGVLNYKKDKLSDIDINKDKLQKIYVLNDLIEIRDFINLNKKVGDENEN